MPKKKEMKPVKAWAAIDNKNKIHIWFEGRLAIYKSTHGEDVSFMRKKNADNFTLIRVVINQYEKTK